MQATTTANPIKVLNNVCELVNDQTKEVIHSGTYYGCLGKFQSLSGFSYSNHKQYQTTTYTIRDKEQTNEA